MKFVFEGLAKNKEEKALFDEYLERFLESDAPAAKIAKVVLALVAVGAILGIGIMAPNAIQLFAQKQRRRNENFAKQKEKIRKYLYYLKNKGSIEFIKEKGDKTVVRITKKGVDKLREFTLEDMVISQPQKWDEKWRLVIFDIPNKMRKGRDALRHKLKELGFYPLQKSIWAYPYPCFDEMIFIAELFKISRFIDIVTAEEIMNEAKLRKHFDLL